LTETYVHLRVLNCGAKPVHQLRAIMITIRTVGWLRFTYVFGDPDRNTGVGEDNGIPSARATPVPTANGLSLM
jgi:hypothetical protein